MERGFAALILGHNIFLYFFPLPLPPTLNTHRPQPSRGLNTRPATSYEVAKLSSIVRQCQTENEPGTGGKIERKSQENAPFSGDAGSTRQMEGEKGQHFHLTHSAVGSKTCFETCCWRIIVGSPGLLLLVSFSRLLQSLTFDDL